MLKYTAVLKDQNYEYKFSDTTTMMKEKYDTEANTAQTYADDLVANDVYGFLNFRLLETDYQNWCQESGYKPSSLNVLRRAMDEKGFLRRSARDAQGKYMKMYLKGNSSYPELIKVEGRLGLFQAGDSEAEVDKLDHNQEDLLKDWSGNGEKDIDTIDPDFDF